MSIMSNNYKVIAFLENTIQIYLCIFYKHTSLTKYIETTNINLKVMLIEHNIELLLDGKGTIIHVDRSRHRVGHSLRVLYKV